MTTLSLKLPEATAKRLRRLARARKVSLSVVISQLLEQYLPAPNKNGASCYEVGRDVWGSVEGPGDLSTNPKRLEGYGE
jgi:hypothetical protein